MPTQGSRSIPRRDLGADDRDHAVAFEQARRDGHRYLLRATGAARQGDCSKAIDALAVGSNRIGSALTHGVGLQAWPEPTKSLMTAQRAAVADVARFCQLAPKGLGGAAARRTRTRR